MYTPEPVEERESPPDSAIGTIGKNTQVLVDYSKPSVKGRKIWGEIVQYDKVWRTGANESTVFEVSKDVKVEGSLLPAGKYGLFTIPGQNEWTIIFNKKWDQWGAGNYKEKDDQLRVKVKPAKAPQFTEQFTFYIQNSRVFFRWENMEVGFKVTEP